MNEERTLASEDENDIGSGGSWGRKLTWSIIGHCGGIVVSLEEVVNDNEPSKTLLVFILNPTPTPCLTFPLWPPHEKTWKKRFSNSSASGPLHRCFEIAGTPACRKNRF